MLNWIVLVVVVESVTMEGSGTGEENYVRELICENRGLQEDNAEYEQEILRLKFKFLEEKKDLKSRASKWRIKFYSAQTEHHFNQEELLRKVDDKEQVTTSFSSYLSIYS